MVMSLRCFVIHIGTSIDSDTVTDSENSNGLNITLQSLESFLQHEGENNARKSGNMPPKRLKV